MEEAGLSVDASALGQLDHEQLDHENQFNFEAEGFDFNFDGVYDESAQFVAETTGAVEDIGLMVKDMDTAVKDMEYEVDDVGTVEVPGNNDEIGYEDEEEEIQIGGGEIQQHETLQVSRDVGFEVDTEAEVKEAVVDYQDEIGYEDDDLGAAEIRIDLKSEQATELVAGVANNQPQEHLEPIEEVHNNGAQSQPEFQIESTEVKDTSATHEELDPTTHDEHGAIDDHPAREENKNEAVFDHDGVADEDYHDESALEDYIVEDEDPSQGPSDLDKAIEDLTNSLPSIPEVEVLYNDGSYSLFGNSDDDPETFFLSGTKHIDRSLTELLSSLREVLSEEIAPTDELVISVESLGLEFGERSNQKFLARSLRELLDCHASLAAKNYGDFPAQPTLRLMVQQDCEEQFLRLLQEAEFEDESSNQSEHYAASEKQDDWPSANSLGDRQGLAGQTEQDDQAENVDSEKHSAEGDHATNVVPDVVPTVLDGEAGQVNSSMEQGFSFQETLDDPEQRSEAADTDEEHADEEMEDLAEEHAEEHTEAYMEEHIEQYADEHMEEHEEEHEEDRTEEPVEGHTEQQTEEQTKGQTEDANQTSDAQDTTGSGIAHEELHSENSPNEPSTGNHETEQHARDQNGDVFENDGAGFDEFDEYAAADTGDTEQTAGLNDDDLMLGYDNDAGLSTIEEQEDDEYDDITVTLNAEDDTEDHNDDSAENTGTVEGDLQHGTSGQEPRNVAHNTSEDAESIHTSTTMNGEEIDYEEQHAANDSLTPGDGLQQSAPSFGGEEDEIDWGNDGYEYNEEEEHSGVDESFASEGQKDVALTPSSLVAKRSRTDEAESLAEESDNKRRRT